MSYEPGPHGSHKHLCPGCNWRWVCTCLEPDQHHGFCFECRPADITPNPPVDSGRPIDPFEAAALKRWDLLKEDQ